MLTPFRRTEFLRSQRPLAALLAAMLLPVVVFAVVVLVQVNDEKRAAAEASLRRNAQSLTHAVDRLIAEQIMALNVLSASPALDHHDFAMFRRIAERIVANRREWLTLVLADETRQWVNTRLPPDAPFPPVVTDGAVRKVFDTGGPAISGRQVLPDRFDQPVVALAAPVRRAGTLRYALVAVLPTAVLSDLLGDFSLPPAAFAAIADDKGHVIAHTEPQTAPMDGEFPITPPGTVEPGTVFETTMPDGRAVHAVMVRSELTGWRICVAIPSAVLLAPVHRTAAVLAAGGGVALLLAAVAGAFLIRLQQRAQRSQAEVARLEAEAKVEQRLSDVAAHLPGIIYRREMRPDGGLHYTYISSGMNAFFGERTTLGRPSIPLQASMDLMPEPDRDRYMAEIRETAETLRPFRFEGPLRSRDGRLRWLRSLAATSRRPDGTVVWDGVALDVTERRQAEIALRDSEARLRLAQEGAGIGTWELDLTTGKGIWSEGMFRMLGIEPDAFEPDLPTYCDRYVHPEDRALLLDAAEQIRVDGKPARIEYRVIGPDGALRWVMAQGRPMPGGDGNPRLFGVLIDITERKVMEEALRAALDAAEMAGIDKARFMATASHDLRQPVQSLLLFVHLLGDRLKDHPVSGLLAMVRQSLDALKAMMDSLLDLSALETGRVAATPAVLPCREVLERLRAEYAPRMAAKGLRFRMVPSAQEIRSDPVLLGRIVGNLLENALKYTDRGGVLVGCRRRGPDLRIEVWDTGAGIPPQKAAEIFEEFVQLSGNTRASPSDSGKGGGLGLGLSIVRRLALLLGHRVDMRSRPGFGSVFAVTVPLAATGTAGEKPV